MTEQYQIALCSCPDQESAEMVANHLIDRRLAACVNIVPNIMSVYRWKGKVESANEVLLVIKTMSRAWDELEKTITQHHPNELPEIITVPITSGLDSYLNWMNDSIT
jgi:periplasmic divalent cation tolerance protein